MLGFLDFFFGSNSDRNRSNCEVFLLTLKVYSRCFVLLDDLRTQLSNQFGFRRVGKLRNKKVNDKSLDVYGSCSKCLQNSKNLHFPHE